MTHDQGKGCRESEIALAIGSNQMYSLPDSDSLWSRNIFSSAKYVTILHQGKKRESLFSGLPCLQRFKGERQRKRASGREPGTSDNQQEARDSGNGKRLTEHQYAQQNGDGGIDIADDGTTAGSHFFDEREVGW